MKRLTSFLIITLLINCMVHASSLSMFSLDHPVYTLVDNLYLAEGKSVPLGSRPWTETDVEHLLSWLDIKTEEGAKLKKCIEDYIKTSDKDFIWKFGADFTPTMYVHSNPEAFSTADDSFYDNDILNRDVIGLSFGMEYRNIIAAYMEFSWGLGFSDATDGVSENVSEYRYNKVFSTNIPFISDGMVSLNFPNRTYLAFGFDAFRFVVARDQVSWGNGVMGNMILGNTLPYHDYISLTFTGSRNFSYQMLVSFFSHSANQSQNMDDSGIYLPSWDRYPLKGLRFFLGHRFEFSFFEGKLTLALNESIMYQSKESYLDPRVINPLILLHNLYIAGNSNSLASLEIEYAPINNLSLYIQFAVDDLAVAGEPKPGNNGASSDGWGIMGGLRFNLPQKSGNYFYGNFELVYTSPFIYHRALDGESWDLYYVSSNRYMSGGVKFITRYLSFPFGSDAIAGLLRFGYNDIDLFKAEANIFFMTHGIIDKFSKTDYFSESSGKPQNTPSTENPFDNTEEGVPEYTLAIGGEGSINATSYLTIDAGAYFITVWNKYNVARKTAFDFQLSMGLSIYY